MPDNNDNEMEGKVTDDIVDDIHYKTTQYMLKLLDGTLEEDEVIPPAALNVIKGYLKDQGAEVKIPKGNPDKILRDDLPFGSEDLELVQGGRG